MRVLILGATGSIGHPLMKELLENGHSVVALARSPSSEERLRLCNAEVVRGDLRQPGRWAATVQDVDAIIHAAATFTDDMGEVDRALIEALMNQAAKSEIKRRFIYTGGCWLYGATHDRRATESSALNPIAAFSWMVENARTLEEARVFDLNIVHPAMVYDSDGGVFTRFIEKAKRGEAIEVWGSLETRWPLVHRLDLAVAYRLVLERGHSGEAYNVASECGVRVGDIVESILRKYRVFQAPRVRSVQEVVAEHGNWAVGPTLDQQMSADKIAAELGWSPRFSNAVGLLSGS